MAEDAFFDLFQMINKLTTGSFKSKKLYKLVLMTPEKKCSQTQTQSAGL